MYLDYTSSDAFKDMEKKSPPSSLHSECPKCKGYGGWNLELNVYGQGEHFKASCSNCWGWGYVKDEADKTCIHDYDTSYRNVGNCLTIWKCRKCGKEVTVDSSD